jgi:hypothetical protein
MVDRSGTPLGRFRKVLVAAISVLLSICLRRLETRAALRWNYIWRTVASHCPLKVQGTPSGFTRAVLSPVAALPRWYA